MKYLLSGLLAALCAAALLSGCAGGGRPQEKQVKKTFTRISQEKAAEMMAKDDGHIVLDVRRREEYDAGHIPGAALLPNESIGPDRPALLPDTEQIILIYCRSGNRSKQAAQKLADMGYVRVYEFGGINTWKGDIEKTACPVTPTAALTVKAGGRTFYADLEDNPSAVAFRDRLSPAALEVEMKDYGGFEKVASLPWKLPQTNKRLEARPGDIVLYGGDRITVYYGENTWDLTLLARISNKSAEELREFLGDGDVTVTFALEWSE